MEGLERNQGGVAETWEKCQERKHILAVYSWHSEGWSVSTVLKKCCQYQRPLDHCV